MKRVALLLLFWIVLNGKAQIPTIVEARIAFDLTVEREIAGENFLSKTNNERLLTPLMKGYRGAVMMVMAKHYFNPLSKWNSFSTGRILLEEAIACDPKNVELNFIRYCIQTNVPAFLNYQQSLSIDKMVLMSKVDELKDQSLQARIINYLRTTDHLTASEKQQLPLQP